MSNDIGTNLDILFNKAENFISTKTVVGDAIIIGDLTLVPLIEVSVGVGAGAGSGKDSNSAGGGLGAKIIPTAVLSIQNGTVQLVNIKNQDAISKLIDMAPGIAQKLNFGKIFGKKEETPVDVVKETINVDETTIIE